MSDTTYDSSDSDGSVATVEAEPRCVGDVTRESASETEETPEASSGSEVAVQCMSCYRSFPQSLWYGWPVVEGRERECYGCCNRF